MTISRQATPLLLEISANLAAEESRVGAKAANLGLLCKLGLPVPPGFVLTFPMLSGQDLTSEISRNWIAEELQRLMQKQQRGFGCGERPLLLAVRASVAAGVPNPLEAVLGIGLNDATAAALATESADPRFAYDSYRRFIQNYAHVVLGDDPTAFEDVQTLFMEERGYVSDSELRGADSVELAQRFKAQVLSNNGEAFVDDAASQLTSTILALARAWAAPRARTQRKLQGAREDESLAIIVQAMVYGTRGEREGHIVTCGAGRAVSRHPQTGAAQFAGEFLPQSLGTDRQLQLKPTLPLQNGGGESLQTLAPHCCVELREGLSRLELAFQDAVEVEFAVEQGALWYLAAKPARRSTAAALQLVVDLERQGVLSREAALLRIDPLSLDQLLHASIDPESKRQVIASGLPASPGAVSGEICFEAEEARRLAADGHRVILVRPETLPEDMRGLHAAEGVLTTRGGMTSHAAVIARGMGKPCVSGASSLRIDAAAGTLTAPGMVLRRGDIITLDGSTGQILKGEVETRPPQLSGNFATLLTWADQCRRMAVRANAETVEDARLALHFGAEGIGLCRSEHMFFEGDRIIAIREMILADKERDRRVALAKALPLLRADFAALFEVMAGLPVTLRLLDPPLHEFLPEGSAEIEAVARALNVETTHLRRRIQDLREQNPMLGHRGVRLLLSYPEIADMQARAIFEAVAQVAKATGKPPIPEIMVPLVVSRTELDLVRARIDQAAADVQKDTGLEFHYRVGTMIELPRAALRAGDIAQSAEFFSFGTNDLTQTTFGISRDDSSRFIGEYTAKGIFAQDPFVSIDVDGVGELIEIAAERGRKARPDLHLGICGEHGGDPASIGFCEGLGLDYVSCSPYRVPIARLAAAQATLRKLSKNNIKSNS